MTRTRKFEQIIKGMNYVSCFYNEGNLNDENIIAL